MVGEALMVVVGEALQEMRPFEMGGVWRGHHELCVVASTRKNLGEVVFFKPSIYVRLATTSTPLPSLPELEVVEHPPLLERIGQANVKRAK